MRKKIALLSTGLVALILGPSLRAEVAGVCKTKTGTGWLEKTAQSDLVLHLEGSYYDMGRQHATLLAEQTKAAVRTLEHTIHKQVPFLPASWVIAAIDKFVYQKEAPFIPANSRRRCRAWPTQAGWTRKSSTSRRRSPTDQLRDLRGLGPATKDGALYFVRSNDDFVAIDPLTKASFNDLKMVMIYKPLGEIPYLLINLPGLIGASDGMNAEGIAIGNMSLPSKYETAAGIPMQFRIKQALAKAKDLDQAVALMTTKPLEGGYNFIVADAKIPSAVAVENERQESLRGRLDGPSPTATPSKARNIHTSRLRDCLPARTTRSAPNCSRTSKATWTTRAGIMRPARATWNCGPARPRPTARWTS